MIFDEQLTMDDNPAYSAFVEKFKPKKTTDDCYTPENIFEAVAAWACKEYGFDPSQIVRPFWPGGDYERFDYPVGCVVLDNPPFSILTEICAFYNEHGIPFFLFAPSLTCPLRDFRNCAIIANADVTYKNGAVVRTAFITNMERDYILRTAPDLGAAVNQGVVTGIFAGLYYAERRKRKLAEEALISVQAADCDLIVKKNKEIATLNSKVDQVIKAVGYDGEGGDA